jgi:hypothetical protein
MWLLPLCSEHSTAHRYSPEAAARKTKALSKQGVRAEPSSSIDYVSGEVMGFALLAENF